MPQSREAKLNNKSKAFKSAAEALLQLGIPERLPALREADVFVRRLILGGSHSVVTYPPLNALQSLQKVGGFQSIICYGSHANLYVHIAFCETQCTFCHYAVKP